MTMALKTVGRALSQVAIHHTIDTASGGSAARQLSDYSGGCFESNGLILCSDGSGDSVGGPSDGASWGP